MSDIRIDRDGVWFYRGAEMSRHDIVSLFYRHLIQDTSGSYFIEMRNQRYPIEVEDTAYVVRAVYWIDGRNGTEECLRMLLSDGSMEELDPGTLRLGKDNIPYCKVRNGRFDARFSTSGYYKLADRIEHDPSKDEYFITLNGRRYCIPDF